MTCPMALELGYEMQTTFWDDFFIADRFGIDAIKDTYKRSFEEWKNNVVYVTELVLVLNWKIWELYQKDEAKAMVYEDLFYECQDWCCNNLKGKDLDYFIMATD